MHDEYFATEKVHLANTYVQKYRLRLPQAEISTGITY
jgi:hypothetical protein